MHACPDGRRNAWEVEVPNGVYMVTVGHSAIVGILGRLKGCTYENVRTPLASGTWVGGEAMETYIFSAGGPLVPP